MSYCTDFSSVNVFKCSVSNTDLSGADPGFGLGGALAGGLGTEVPQRDGSPQRVHGIRVWLGLWSAAAWRRSTFIK